MGYDLHPQVLRNGDRRRERRGGGGPRPPHHLRHGRTAPRRDQLRDPHAPRPPPHAVHVVPRQEGGAIRRGQHHPLRLHVGGAQSPERRRGSRRMEGFLQHLLGQVGHPLHGRFEQRAARGRARDASQVAPNAQAAFAGGRRNRRRLRRTGRGYGRGERQTLSRGRGSETKLFHQIAQLWIRHPPTTSGEGIDRIHAVGTNQEYHERD
mmetsp:Transcript_21076/g.39825  ORF Transcript_21076/g.39825 Transcript_21076/m.39825 type:complete len:208 (+) Transcript_21076:281-904(+)